MQEFVISVLVTALLIFIFMIIPSLFRIEKYAYELKADAKMEEMDSFFMEKDSISQIDFSPDGKILSKRINKWDY